MTTMARPPLCGGIVLVTGASSGIGRELAVQLAARAKTLVLAARRTERLEQLRASMAAGHPQQQVVVLGAGLSSGTEVDRIISEVQQQAGPVDILVNNAGIGDQALAPGADGRSCPVDWVNARQALQRILLTASVGGAAAALHTQPLEFGPLRESIRTGLGGGAYPQLILRFGMVIQAAGSVRRPPDDVLSASGEGTETAEE
jgi:NAD(P)-dependent dehydrogenase (short-subunit alcohol dehydrogenase family)